MNAGFVVGSWRQIRAHKKQICRAEQAGPARPRPAHSHEPDREPGSKEQHAREEANPARAGESTPIRDHIETNLLSSALSGLVNQSSAYVAGGVVPARAPATRIRASTRTSRSRPPTGSWW